MIRYNTHFPNKETRCLLTDNNPGFIPVIETGGIWGFGRAVCICDSRLEAERICDLLNAHGLEKVSPPSTSNPSRTVISGRE